jgi:hypothetical protein
VWSPSPSERIAKRAAYAGDEREEHDRKLLQECIEAQEEGRSRQRQDHPVLRTELRPGADAGTAGTKPLHAEIAIGEGRQHAAERALAEGGRRRSDRVNFSGGRGSFGGTGISQSTS